MKGWQEINRKHVKGDIEHYWYPVGIPRYEEKTKIIPVQGKWYSPGDMPEEQKYTKTVYENQCHGFKEVESQRQKLFTTHYKYVKERKFILFMWVKSERLIPYYIQSGFRKLFVPIIKKVKV